MDKEPQVSQNIADGRNFYVFGEIDESFAKDIVIPFTKELDRQNNFKNKEDINIYITSRGGYCNYAFDLISHIEKAKNSGIRVNTYVSSMACSAGGLIAVTGSVRYVSTRAYYHLHYARGWDYSHNPEMTDRNAENSRFVQQCIVDIYKKYTKLKDVEKKLLADNFMINGGANIIKSGLADKMLN